MFVFLLNRFPDFTFIGDTNIARTAAVATRYTDASLKGIIADVHFLSLTDYLVCTFSSQVSLIFATEKELRVYPKCSYQAHSMSEI